jgi:hypothetical protein
MSIEGGIQDRPRPSSQASLLFFLCDTLEWLLIGFSIDELTRCAVTLNPTVGLWIVDL